MPVARLKNFDPFTPNHLATYRLFCLHGENDGLIRERAAALRAAFTALGTDPSVVDLDGDALAHEPFALSDAIGSPSLFAERQLIRIALGARATADAFANALPALARADGVMVIVDAGDDKRQESTVALLAADPSCFVVACPPDRSGDLADHARAVLGEGGVLLDDAVAQELVELADGDRALLGNELAKLLLTVERGATLDAATMRAAVADEAGVLLDDAAASILDGDIRAALDATDRLSGGGIDAAQLAGAALRKALWHHGKASGTKATDLRRAIARLNDAVRASRSNDRLADTRAEWTLIRTAQFLRRTS